MSVEPLFAMKKCVGCGRLFHAMNVRDHRVICAAKRRRSPPGGAALLAVAVEEGVMA